MTNNYDFILKNRRWSFSSVSSFQTCRLGFKMSYIDNKEKEQNIFGEFGLLVHKVLEQFFLGELEVWDLLQYYLDNFDKYVKAIPPAFPKNMIDIYYQAGIKYFENFSFDKSLYEIIAIEETIDSEYNGLSLVTKPDLILKELSTGEYHLIDFKTARLKKSKKDKEKQLVNYMNQFNLYCYFFEQEKGIHIDKIIIWFIRDEIEIVKDVVPSNVQNTLNWFENSINKAMEEEKWIAKDNGYFCKEICSFRSQCTARLDF